MSSRYTSDLAYRQTTENLKGLQREVFDCVRFWSGAEGPSLEDIARRIGRKESSVCGRVNELKKLGAIIEGPLKINSSGKRAMTYIAREYKPQAYRPAQTELFETLR